MPLTAKERMRQYRERNKLNPQKLAEIKQKDIDRKKANKKALTKRELKAAKNKNKNAVRRHRAKKKASEYLPVGQDSTPKKISPQLLSRAKRRAERFMPKSPRTKKAVIKSLGQDFGLYSPPESRLAPASSSRMGNNQETKKMVEDFYRTTSYICPGLKDFVIIRENGEKQKIQKQFMLVTLKEAYSSFLEQHPDTKVGFSKFASLRPRSVCLQGSIPHNTCLCKIHENIRLLLEALSKTDLRLSTNFREFLNDIVCDQNSSLCMKGNCEHCPHYENFTLEDEEDGTHHIQWNQWSVSDQMKTVKVLQSGSLNDCIATLKSNLPQFLRHTYTKRMQAQHFVNEKASVEDNVSKVVIQVDFAENYLSKFQDEIQSAYWAYTQVTLFTACAWAKEGIHSIVVASDYLHHDKFAVNTFIQEVLTQTEKKFGRKFEEVVFFSDGAASQFKQKFHLNNITFLPWNITWHFFATSHGKGPVDGIGGELKRRVKLKVLSGHTSVLNSKDFVQCAMLTESKIQVVHVSEQEVRKDIQMLTDQSDKCVAIPKTQTVHFVRAISPGIIEYKEESSSEKSKIHHFLVPASDEDNSEVDGDEANMVNVAATLKLQVSSWVRVEYCQKKNKLTYIGQILSKSADGWVVKFVSQVGGEGNRYIWPDKDDEDDVPETDILNVLSEPQMDRRGIMTFETQF